MTKERKVEITNKNCIPPNGRSFFIRLELVAYSPSLWGLTSDLAKLDIIIDLKDLWKTVSISTAVIPSRKNDVRRLIGSKLYSTLVSLV